VIALYETVGKAAPVHPEEGFPVLHVSSRHSSSFHFLLRNRLKSNRKLIVKC
jgi:hypothetical protein